MPDIAGAEIRVDRGLVTHRRISLSQASENRSVKVVERCPVTEGDIVNLICGVIALDRCREKICLHNILNVAKVATCFSVAVDGDGFRREAGRQPTSESRRHKLPPDPDVVRIR